MMNHPSPAPDLVKVSEIFLIPSSFLVAALGTADTNIHRAAVSVVGLSISVLWWISSKEAFDDIAKLDRDNQDTTRPIRTRILRWLPAIFVTAWLVSSIGHALIWNRPLATNLI